MGTVKAWLRRWLGVETLEREVVALRARVQSIEDAPKSTPPVDADMKRFRWLHRLDMALRESARET